MVLIPQVVSPVDITAIILWSYFLGLQAKGSMDILSTAAKAAFRDAGSSFQEFSRSEIKVSWRECGGPGGAFFPSPDNSKHTLRNLSLGSILWVSVF